MTMISHYSHDFDSVYFVTHIREGVEIYYIFANSKGADVADGGGSLYTLKGVQIRLKLN